PGNTASGQSAPGRRPSRRVDVGPSWAPSLSSPRFAVLVGSEDTGVKLGQHAVAFAGRSMVRPGTRRCPMRWWMLLVALGLAGCDPTLATLQRLVPLASAFVQANSGSMLTPRPYRGLDDPTSGRPRVIQPDGSATTGD